MLHARCPSCHLIKITMCCFGWCVMDDFLSCKSGSAWKFAFAVHMYWLLLFIGRLSSLRWLCKWFYCIFCCFFQCKITVPKMGSILDLSMAVSGLLKVAPDKVLHVFYMCRLLYCCLYYVFCLCLSVSVSQILLTEYLEKYWTYFRQTSSIGAFWDKDEQYHVQF